MAMTEILQPLGWRADHNGAEVKIYVWERGSSIPRVAVVQLTARMLDDLHCEVVNAQEEVAQGKLF